MRYSCLTLVALMFAAHWSNPAQATSIYRCVGADGVFKFQDAPCQSGESSRRIELPDAPTAPMVEAPTSDPNEPAAKSPAVAQREPAAAIESDIGATLCTRADGSRYLSDSGHGHQQAVPIGMLGIPGDSLAGAYAGRDGIGVSAPGLREPPVDRSRHGQLGGMYTWVEDPCVQINAARLCGFLGDRISDAERRLRFAFSDTSAQVRQELDSLRQRARQCPR